MSKNVIFGYGNIGKLVAKELEKKGDDVVVASRRAEKVDGFSAVICDTTNKESVLKATAGADRIIVTIGLPYKLKVWQKDWPVIIDNIIEAAKTNNCKIAFFDNIYLYGPAPLLNPISENHPRNTPSKKGVVRKLLVEKLETAMAQGVPVVIGRSADFYGPGASNSMITMAIDAMVLGKKGYYLGQPAKLHSFAYIPDTALAFSLLLFANDTYGQTWHLPVAPAITGNEIMQMATWGATTKYIKPKWQAMPKKNAKIARLFVPPLRELYEMMYQFENDYVMDSSKFMKRFRSFQVTSYANGIAATLDYAKKIKATELNRVKKAIN